MSDYCYKITPKRPNFVATITPDERAAMGAHFVYLQGLQAQGRIIFVGRAENGEFGIVIFRAGDLAEAQAIASADPAVVSGVVSVEVHAFIVVPMG